MFMKARRQTSKQFENDVRVVQVLRVLISHRKAHLIDIQFPEIVLIVRKCAGKDGLNSTWKCTSALLNTIRCHGYKVGYLS